MDFELEKLALLLLGWLLGLLSPGIAERIRRKHRQADVMGAVTAELRELRYMMSVVAYLTFGRLAEVTDEFLDWLIPTVKAYHGPEEIAGLPGRLEELRKLTEQMRREVHLGSRRSGSGLSIKEYSLPLVAAMSGEISICPLAFQRGVLRIVNQLDRYNQHVRYTRSQFEKTFDPGIVDANRQAVLSNLESGYRELAGMAQRIADAITELLTGSGLKGKAKDPW